MYHSVIEGFNSKKQLWFDQFNNECILIWD